MTQGTLERTEEIVVMENRNASEEAGVEIKRTCCGICNQYSHCGIEAYVKDGRIIRAEGDAENPHSKGKLCPRGAGIRQYVYNKERILHPLRRVGEKGSGEFEQISWEEAYKTIAEKLNGYKAEYGPESVAFFAGFSKWFRPVLLRLASSFGSPNYMTEGSCCQEAHKMAWWLVFGGIAGPDLENAELALIWSRNPFFSTMDNNRNHYDLMEKGKPYIVVDPRKTSFTQKALLHLQLRPGTDGALALGMANVIIQEQLFDKDFVEQHVQGFAEFAAMAAEYTPQRTEELTGVPRDLMAKAARMYANAKPAALLTSASPAVHHVNGVQNYRAVISLVALTGNYDITGGNRVIPSGYLCVTGFTPSNEAEYVGEFQFDAPAIGHKEYPVWADFIPEQAQAMLLPSYILGEGAYPVKAVLGMGMNHMMWPDSTYMLGALKELDFFVDVDLFLTETARYADIVLPACTSLERCDVKAFSDGYVQCFPPAIEPLGESRHDIQILLELAQALGLDDPHLTMSYQDYMNYIIEPTGLTVEEIQANGGILLTKNTLPAYREKKYLEHGFPTLSKKAELASSVIEKYAAEYHYDIVPKYRSYAEIYPRYAEGDWPFLMNTGSRKPQYIHSRTYRMRWLAQLEDNDLLDIHPEDAAPYGIQNYDKLRISTPSGSIEATAHLTATVCRGVVHMYHGNEHANPSYLMAHDFLDPISGYPGYKSFPCRVERLSAEGGSVCPD